MNGFRHLGHLAALATLFAGAAPAAAQTCPAPQEQATDEPLLHVPSPDWRDQIIYFVMIDRFADGDACNNDKGAGEYDPTKESHFNGGDLKGIGQRLSYIQDLGATTLWITPPVANQWWDGSIDYGGYHGYWARDFSSVDEHFGTLADYQRLSSDLHRRGMYLMQDIVVNHTGNFFGYRGPWRADDPTASFWANTASAPTARPTQAPFDRNDPRKPEDRAAGIYHWTPDVSDTSDRRQELTYQTSGLDDIATENPVVVDAFKRIYGDWVRKVGVDAYRIDTAKYADAPFYGALFHDPDGVGAAAAATGRKDFLTIGEIYVTSDPLADNGERSMTDYLDGPAGKRIAAPLGFPLYLEMDRVFARGAPTAWLSHRLKTQMARYPDPYRAANFVDNHDVERFLAHGDERGFRLAYALMMTVPGIPVIYQGDEQGFSVRRKAMFKGGHASDRDQYDTAAPLYRHIQALARMRRAHPVFSRGTLAVLADNAGGAGVFAFERRLGDQRAYVILNTADHPVLLNGLRLDVADPARLRVLFADGHAEPFVPGERATLTRALPPKSAVVLLGTAGAGTPLATPAGPVIERIAETYRNQDSATIAGHGAPPGARLLRVIDGDLAAALPFRAGADGRWQVDLPVRLLGDHQRSIEIFAPDQGVASPPRRYRVVYDRADVAAAVTDPPGDARGPTGGYRLPTNATFGCQMDFRQASARASGAVLELTLKLCAVSAVWSPLNGFDHAAINSYISLPGRAGGASALPGLDAAFPGGGRWHIGHELHGWGNVAFASAPGDAARPGKPFTYAPQPSVDRANGTITITYDGARLGVADWAGASIYVTSWDRDGGDGSYRRITPAGGQWEFGGAAPGSPLILDDIRLTLAPAKR